MSRRTTKLESPGLDGTSQRGRAASALDPGYARIDERSDADWVAFVRAFAQQLRYFEASGDAVVEAGDWSAFAGRDDLSDADIAAYPDDPSLFSGDQARWLARPHFSLFLTFLALMRHVRDQQNALTGRHLEYYYKDILGMQPLPAKADRVAVLFQLASNVTELLLPAGTALTAGQDSAGVERIYRTERELLIHQARVSELRSVYVDRRITEIPDVRMDSSLTAAGAFDQTLRIALGTPNPGDPVEPWEEQPIDTAFFVGLAPLLDFCRSDLYLEHYELRSLMQYVTRRAADEGEWAEINRLMGVVDPEDPRDFNTNLESRVGPLDFKADGLPQVDDIDDVYEHRTETDVRAYIDTKLGVIGYDNFTALMPIKLRIDAEWAEINRLLERAGRRQRSVLAWSLSPEDPTDFDANLALALDGHWPPAWPTGISSIYEYEARVRALEGHLCHSVERMQRLVAFASTLGDSADARSRDWSEVDAILIDAHAELVYTGRREVLADVRADDDSIVGFDRVATYVLREGKVDTVLSWSQARPELDALLDAGQMSVLDGFRDQLTVPGSSKVFGWSDVYRSLELAQRTLEQLPVPVARKVEWRNLYAYPDATARLDDAATSPRWVTFGGLPEADPNTPPEPNIGLALRSPMLALSQGTRTLTLTVGLSPVGADRDSVVRALGADPATLSAESLLKGMHELFVVQVSSAKGWLELPMVQAKLATGQPGDDYWSLRGVERTLDEDRPALQFTLLADPTVAALAPLPDQEAPILRLLLRPRWEDKGKQWICGLSVLEPLVVAAVHLAVDVKGLTDLRLQQGDQKLDPRKPFEPFGGRPAVGSRLYLSHPELIQNRLDLLRFNLSWMGLPAKLSDHYKNYEGVTGGASFITQISLLDRNLSLPLADPALFEDDASQVTASTRALEIPSVGSAISKASSVFNYVRRTDLSPGTDLRTDSRALRWELTPQDFGHPVYASLAARKSREQSVALSNGQITDAAAADAYRVEVPYTPTLLSLSVDYTAALELDPLQQLDTDQILHIHPFGQTLLSAEDRGLVPRYESAGELYIGVSGLRTPQHLALLFQLAEGTSDPDLEPAPVAWHVLDDEAWLQVVVVHDSTRGLINSGIVELELPAVTPGARLPAGPYWLRASIPQNTASVCDTVAIRAQAVFAQLEDRGNAPEHYAEPLPSGSLTRLVEPNARISKIEQPFTSFGAEPAEPPERFNVRVSERLRHKQRALAPWDYERLVLQEFGQIYKAKCLPSRGDGVVEVIVIPDIRDALPADTLAPKAPANLLADITAYLQARAPGAASVRVRNARYVPVRVRLPVRFLPGQDEGFAKQRLNEDLKRFLSPWAFDDGEELMIGGKIYANSIVDFVDRCSYVDYVAQITLFRGTGGDDFALLPLTEDYHVATESDDEVLVAAPEHDIDVISELGYDQSSFTGINYMKIELDFIVGA